MEVGGVYGDFSSNYLWLARNEEMDEKMEMAVLLERVSAREIICGLLGFILPQTYIEPKKGPCVGYCPFRASMLVWV